MPRKPKVKEEEQEGIEDGLLAELLDEEECRQRQATILRRLPGERRRLMDTLKAYRAVQHRAWLAVSYLRDDLLTNDEAKRATLEVKLAVQTGIAKSPIKEDKVALCDLEVGEAHLNYELAKMAVESSEKDYDMLQSQMIYYASIRKNNGPVVPLEQSVNATYGAPRIWGPAPSVETHFVEPYVEKEKDDFVPPPVTFDSPAFDLVRPEDLEGMPGDIPIDLSKGNAFTVTPTADIKLQDEPAPLFPDDPISQKSWDLIKPEQIEKIKEIAAEKKVFENGICGQFMGCTVKELTIDAADALIRYLEALQPSADDDEGKDVSDIYGGSRGVYKAKAASSEKAEYSDVQTNPDGTVTPHIKDSDIPF